MYLLSVDYVVSGFGMYFDNLFLNVDGI